MKRKHGFTLVELVIVIAIVAILAGVMIAVFAGVVKSAKESAALQEMKNAELQQKADDILQKVDNADWLGWADFEDTLAKKLAEQTTNQQTFYTAALKDALDEYIAKAAEGNTALTEAQVKYIVENAVAGKSTLTEDQVKAIVNTVVANNMTGVGTSNLTKSQVQSIVDTAQSKNLTAAQVTAIIEKYISGTVPTEAQITAIVKANSLTADDITALLEATLPVTKKVTPSDNLSTIAKALNSGSTIMFTGDWSNTEAAVSFPENKTLYFRGSNVKTLTINAPAATIGVYNNVTNLNVTAVAMASLHLYGEVAKLKMEQGRAVLESGATVAEVNVAPAEKASVALVVTPTVTVPTLKVVASGTGVEIANAGKIQAVTVDKPAGTGSTASTVVINNEAGAEIPATIEGTASDSVVNTNDDTTYVTVSSQAGLTEAISGTKQYIKLTGNVTLSAPVAIPVDKNIVLDTNGYTIDSTNVKYAFEVYGSLSMKGTGSWSGDRFANVFGLLTINEGTYTGKAQVVEMRGTYTYNNNSYTSSGDFVMNGGKITATSYYCVVVWGTGASFTMNDGSLETPACCIGGNGTTGCGGTDIVINGGTLTSTDGNVVYHPQLGNFTINGGKVKSTSLTGYAGIEMKSGNLTVNGGTIKTTGGSDETSFIFGNGSSNVPSAISLVDHASYAGNINVELNGGIFASEYSNCVGIFAEDKSTPRSGTVDGKTESGFAPKLVDAKAGLSLVVTGGTFSSDVSDYVAAGYSYNKTTGMVTAN